MADISWLGDPKIALWTVMFINNWGVGALLWFYLWPPYIRSTRSFMRQSAWKAPQGRRNSGTLRCHHYHVADLVVYGI